MEIVNSDIIPREYALQAEDSQYMTFEKYQHPFRDWETLKPYKTGSRLLELWIPRTIFSTSATNFLQIRHQFGDMARYYYDLLTIWNYIWIRAYQNDTGLAKDLAANAQNPTDEPDTDQIETDILNKAAQFEQNGQFDNEDDEMGQRLYTFFEVVLSAAGGGQVAGFRKRIVYNSMTGFNPGIWLQTLFRANALTKAKAFKRNLKAGVVQYTNRINSILFQDYVKAVEFYTGVFYNHKDKKSWSKLFDKHHPLNPLNVFTLDFSCTLAKKAGAMPQFCRISNYVVSGPYEGMVYTAPEHGMHMYLTTPAHEHPKTMYKYQWPHIVKPSVREADNQLKLYEALKAQDIIPPEDLMDAEVRMPTPTEAYNILMRNKVGTLGNNDLEALKLRQQHRTQQDTYIIENWYKQTLDSTTTPDEILQQKKHIMMHEYRLKTQRLGLQEFAQIFCAEGDVPDSVKMLCIWWDNFLVDCPSGKLPKAKSTCNLSRFGDSQAELAAACESVFQVNTLQLDVVSGLLKAYHVYTYVSTLDVLVYGTKCVLTRCDVVGVQGSTVSLSYADDWVCMQCLQATCHSETNNMMCCRCIVHLVQENAGRRVLNC